MDETGELPPSEPAAPSPETPSVEADAASAAAPSMETAAPADVVTGAEAQSQLSQEDQQAREQGELLFDVHQQNYLDELLPLEQQQQLLTDNYLKTLLRQGRLLVNDQKQPDGTTTPAASEVDKEKRQFVDFQGDLTKARQLAQQLGLQVDDLKALAEWGEKNDGKSLNKLSSLPADQRDEATAALMARLGNLSLEIQQQLMPRFADVPSASVAAVGFLDAENGSFVTSLQNEERVRLHLEYRLEALSEYAAWQAQTNNTETSFEEYLQTQKVPEGRAGAGQTWATHLYTTIEAESKINAEVQYQADMADNPITVFKKQMKRRRARAGQPADDAAVDAEMQTQINLAEAILNKDKEEPGKLDQAKKLFLQLLIAAAGAVGESITTVSVGDLFSALFGLRQDYSSSYGYGSPEKMSGNEALNKDRVITILKNAPAEEHKNFFTYYFGDSTANGGINDTDAKKLAYSFSEGKDLSVESITEFYQQLFTAVFERTKINSTGFEIHRAKLRIAFAKAYTRDNPVFFAQDVWHDDAGVYATLAKGKGKTEFDEIVNKATSGTSSQSKVVSMPVGQTARP